MFIIKIKYMRFLFLLCMIIFWGITKSKSLEIKECVNKPYIHPLSISTLDSLQGIWLNEDDSLNKLTILGRKWLEEYNDNNVTSYPHSYKIFFSDTAINISDTLPIPLFDTTTTSGNYLILKSLLNNSISCIFLSGFNLKNSDTTFVIRPATGLWRASSVRLFKKIH